MPSNTYSAQAGWQRFAVPDGVTKVTVDLKGAGSGSIQGGHVAGWMKVSKGDVLFLLVGAAGNAASGRQGGAGAHGGGGPGGDGATGNTGGRGGGGAAAIRLNSTDGTIKAAAGGAGGRSGDSGAGGRGGDTTGEHGALGNAGHGTAGNATGGTQIQPGAGGSSGAGKKYAGNDGTGGALGVGGAGGQHTAGDSWGGGGGGGGYRPGGGGVAGLDGHYPGGGGGGGSNFSGGLVVVTASTQGGGGTGDAQIVLSWDTPAPANQPPGTPSDLKIDGKAESPGFGTRSTGQVTISAVVFDSHGKEVAPTHTGGAETQSHQKCRLVVRYSDHKSMSRAVTVKSALVPSGKRATVKLTGLSTNTHYYVRAWSEDSAGLRSDGYNGADFWTNRPPDEPTLQSPTDNTIINSTDATTFNWAHNDPDPNDGQGAFTLRWRRAKTSSASAGKWQLTTIERGFDNYVTDPGTFKVGRYYEWTVRTRDQQNAWGPFAVPRQFWVRGVSAPPVLTYPINDTAVEVSDTVVMKWRFKDPSPSESQTKADLQYRVVGTTEWVLLVGGGVVPGGDQEWELPDNTFAPGYAYEWQVRTYHTSDGLSSDWSDSETFHAYRSAVDNIPIDFTDIGQVLGSGHNRVFVYDRGGIVRRGEITPCTSVAWGRTRDAITQFTVSTNVPDALLASLLKATHTWMHELVIFRDGVRVAEGPITNIQDSPAGFTITANDVMQYTYRRIIRHGYNDTYKVVNGVTEGLLTVVQRAALLIADGLARNDPNVLPYLTTLSYPDDAREARVVPDYSKTVWADVDDMAANSGLDYSVIGRRIILNDTHRPVGRLPEFRSGYFSAPPVITEYGGSVADYYAVTDNNGLWGAAEHRDSPYGGVEILSSSYTNANNEPKKLTSTQRDRIVKTLTEQAKRGIANRYPAPYQVRVPDNSQLMPDTPVDINSLVPGVWIPLRASGTVIEVSQWQKLDSVTVTETVTDSGSTETVTVVMSPAPNAGQDPDADEAALEVGT